MKNFILILGTFMLFVACSQKSNDDRTVQLLSDSLQFQNTNVYTDFAPEEYESNAAEAHSPVKKTVRPVVIQPTTGPEAVPANDNNTNTTVSSYPANTNSSAGSSSQEKKKGISNAAKGAVIGGVAGAVGGAIIAKKKGVGAAVGGVIGAAGGYIIGKQKDKKK